MGFSSPQRLAKCSAHRRHSVIILSERVEWLSRTFTKKQNHKPSVHMQGI